jgi:HEAT repeat protein
MSDAGQLLAQMKLKDLIHDLEHGGLDQRKQAVIALGLKKEDPEIATAVKPLIQALQAEDSDLRALAAMSLGFLGDERSVLPLISALRDSYYGCRQMAARALGWSRDPRSMSYLVTAAADANTEVQESAVQALVDLDDLNTVDSLISLLTHGNSKVRRIAAQGLNKLTRKKFIWGNQSQAKWTKWWDVNKQGFFR